MSIYCMSDIHGMYDKYIEMLKRIQFSDTDTLYVIGDIIDRGNGSIKIIQDMMKRPNVYPIFGNHELMAVKCLRYLCGKNTHELIQKLDKTSRLSLAQWMDNGGETTLLSFSKLSIIEQNEIVDYLMEFVAYEEISVNGKDYLLVHAGLNHFKEDKPLYMYEIEDLVWTRPDFRQPYYQDKYVVVGHTPTQLVTYKAEIFKYNHFILIDCGACQSSGKLACLCLDTMAEYYI